MNTIKIRNLAIGIGVIFITCGFLAAVLTLGEAVGETVVGNIAKEQARIKREAEQQEAADKINASRQLSLGSLVDSEGLKNSKTYDPENFNLNSTGLAEQTETNLRQLPSLMRGTIPIETAATISGKPKRNTPPRMCEMPKDYYEVLEASDEVIPQGYQKDNSYVRIYKHRRGFLNERELQAAKIAWGYFEQFTQETTGLANSVGGYPSTTMWDTASYVSGLVSAYELCLIENRSSINVYFYC